MQLLSAGCDLQVLVDKLVDCDTVSLRDSHIFCTSADIGHVGILVSVEACAVGQLVGPDIATVNYKLQEGELAGYCA